VIHDAADGVQSNDSELNSGTNPPYTIAYGDGGLVDFSISESRLETLSAGANIVLQATNDITLNDLADNVLSIQANGSGSLTITADADGDGIGAFIMNSADTIQTQRGSVTISGVDVTIGHINTSIDNRNGGDVTLTATGTDIDIDGAAVNGILNVGSVTSQGGVRTSTGSGWSGGDVSLIGNDVVVGSVNSSGGNSLGNNTNGGTSGFVSVIANNDLQISSGASNGIRANGGSAVNGNLNVDNVESITANAAATNTLAGDDETNVWTIGGSDSGTVVRTVVDVITTTDFVNFGNLVGGAADDRFIVQNGGSLSGLMDGGANTMGEML
jgi:hypothetical protein